MRPTGGGPDPESEDAAGGVLHVDLIRRLLEELSAELASQGVRGDMLLVGGAALVLAYRARPSTRVLDAVFEPKSVVYEAARRVGRANDLPDDWLNDAVKAFVPAGAGEDGQVIFDRPGLTVRVPKPEYLLAMKLLAAKVERDVDDIRLLLDACRLETAEEATTLVARVYPNHEIEAKVRFLAEELFDESR